MVDVVIPAFNRPALLAEAVLSVQQQTWTDWKLIIVDDASTIPLGVEKFSGDARIRTIRNPQNRGPAFARNIGALSGQSPFIAFLDCDDLWHEEKLSKQMTFFATYPEMAWCHTDELWQRSGVEVKQKSEHRKQEGQFLKRAFERCLISPSAVMMKRSFFEASGGFLPSLRWAEDFELWLRLLYLQPIGFIDEALAIKRTGDWDQLSRKINIDHYRVLALHRFWRRVKNTANSHFNPQDLLDTMEKKTTYLLKGAQKYGHQNLQKKYQLWLTLFSILRTRPMRKSSRGISK